MPRTKSPTNLNKVCSQWEIANCYGDFDRDSEKSLRQNGYRTQLNRSDFSGRSLFNSTVEML